MRGCRAPSPHASAPANDMTKLSHALASAGRTMKLLLLAVLVACAAAMRDGEADQLAAAALVASQDSADAVPLFMEPSVWRPTPHHLCPILQDPGASFSVQSLLPPPRAVLARTSAAPARARVTALGACAAAAPTSASAAIARARVAKTTARAAPTTALAVPPRAHAAPTPAHAAPPRSAAPWKRAWMTPTSTVTHLQTPKCANPAATHQEPASHCGMAASPRNAQPPRSAAASTPTARQTTLAT